MQLTDFIGDFGARVKQSREKAGITQEELCARALSVYGIRISQPFLSQLENGRFTEIGFLKLYTISKILKVPIDYLVKGE